MNNLSYRDRKIIWHPYTQDKITPLPLAVKKARGSYIFLQDNKKLFDGISSWWTNAHGHCHPHINQAIFKQAQNLEHIIFANFTHEPAVRLAEHIKSVAPRGLSRVFYSDNGSTAVEVAIKMAYQYWLHKKKNRPFFIALERGYHGDTFGAMAVSEHSTFTKPFWPLLFKVLRAPSTCVSQVASDMSEADITNRALTSLKNLFLQYPEKVAGVIIEPMLMGAGGMRIFTNGFLSGIRKLCDENNALLIADEVATGFFRTGKWFACHHEDVSPDIMCLSKALSGGYLPLAATLAKEKIYQAFLSDQKADALLHGHSFTANPLGCAAALASFEIFQQQETQARIKDICQAITDGIKKFSGLPQVKNARSIGSIGIIELKVENGGYTSRAAEKIYHHCFSHGLFIRPLGNVIYLMPAFCATPVEINWAFDTIFVAITNG